MTGESEKTKWQIVPLPIASQVGLNSGGVGQGPAIQGIRERPGKLDENRVTYRIAVSVIEGGHSTVLLIGTAGNEGTARIWNAATGKELRRLVATGPLNSLAFSPDTRYLLTSSGDGAAQQWDVDYHITVKYLCSRLVRDFTDDERGQFDILDQDPTCPKQ